MSTVQTNTIKPLTEAVGISGGLIVPSATIIDGVVKATGLTTLSGTLGVTGASTIATMFCTGNLDLTAATKITTGLVTCGTAIPVSGNDMATKAYVESQALGVGQTWGVFVVGSTRVKNTVYQNSTGKPIMVLLGSSSDAAVSVLCDAANPPTTVVQQYTLANQPHPVSFVVPNGFYYKVNCGGLSTWAELR